jgi:hypothetical protein
MQMNVTISYTYVINTIIKEVAIFLFNVFPDFDVYCFELTILILYPYSTLHETSDNINSRPLESETVVLTFGL